MKHVSIFQNEKLDEYHFLKTSKVLLNVGKKWKFQSVPGPCPSFSPQDDFSVLKTILFRSKYSNMIGLVFSEHFLLL